MISLDLIVDCLIVDLNQKNQAVCANRVSKSWQKLDFDLLLHRRKTKRITILLMKKGLCETREMKKRKVKR